MTPFLADDLLLPATYRPGAPVGSPVPAVRRINRPDLKQEYVAHSTTHHAATVPLALPPAIDDTARLHGPDHYEWMLTDPVVAASVRTLKLAILAGGMDLKSPYQPDPVEKARKKAAARAKEAPADPDPDAPPPAPDPEADPEAEAEPADPKEAMAADVVKFCWRAVERCKGWNAFLMDLLGAAAVGNKMAEKVFEVAPSGEDAGKLVWKSIKVKPRAAWQFVVDDSMNVLGVSFREKDGTKAFLPREKVIILTWDARDADPRGTSILRPAVEPCNLKRLLWPQLYKHACQFGSASLVGKTAPGEVDRYPVDDNGVPIPGAPPVTPQQFMAGSLVHFQNGSVMVVPAGAEVLPIQPQGDGGVFHAAIDLMDRQIVQAILLQTRATMEAEHGSKADSETGRGMFNLEVDSGRGMLSQTLRDDGFRQLVELNYGKDVADEFTPIVTFGTKEEDKSSQWAAVASLMGSKYLGESQLEELDSMMGLPIRDKAADEAAAKAKADEAFAQQRVMNGDQDRGEQPMNAGSRTVAPGKRPDKAEFSREDLREALEENRRVYGAGFAHEATQVGPWRDEDLIAARALLNAVMPSAAALKRWQSGEETADGRRFHLETIVADAKAKLTASGAALMAELVLRDATKDIPQEITFNSLAEFASPWETVSRWRDGVARTLRHYYLAGALALLGPGEFTADDWEAMRGGLDDQLGYLDGFAGAVVSKEQAWDGTLASRTGRYGDSVWVVSMAVERTRMKGLGMAQEHSRLGASADSCGRGDKAGPGVPSCRQEQAKGWQPIGTLTLPGKRKCKGACKCHMEYR